MISDEAVSERRGLILDLAQILVPSPRPILNVDSGGDIIVDVPQLADALLAAGYGKWQPRG